MFDVEKIAKRIKETRIEKNMTQGDLADLMGVSYQAVSNWERGNSMPDISKLEDLCGFLEISVGELLGIENKETKTIEKIIENKEDVPFEEIADVAPIVPPKVLKEKTKAAEEKRKNASFKNLSELFVYLDDDYITELVHKTLEKAKDTVKKLDGIFDVIEFIPEESHYEIVGKAGAEDLDELADCIEDLGDKALELFAEKCIEFERLDIISENAEMFSEEALDKFIDACLEKEEFDELSEVYPYFEDEQLKRIAKALIENGENEYLAEIAEYM